MWKRLIAVYPIDFPNFAREMISRTKTHFKPNLLTFWKYGGQIQRFCTSSIALATKYHKNFNTTLDIQKAGKIIREILVGLFDTRIFTNLLEIPKMGSRAHVRVGAISQNFSVSRVGTIPQKFSYFSRTRVGAISQKFSFCQSLQNLNTLL